MRLKPCLDEVHELGAAANSPRAGGGSRRIVAEIRQTAKSAGRDWERGRLGDWEWRREGGEEWLVGRCSRSSGRVLLLLLILILILILLLLDRTRPGLDRAASPLDHEQNELQQFANEYEDRDAEYEYDSEPEAEPSQDALNHSRDFHPGEGHRSSASAE